MFESAQLISKQSFVSGCGAVIDEFAARPEFERTAERCDAHRRLADALKRDALGECASCNGHEVFIFSTEAIHDLRTLATDTNREIAMLIVRSVMIIAGVEKNVRLAALFAKIPGMLNARYYLEEEGVTPGHLYREIAVELRRSSTSSRFSAQCIALADFLEMHCCPPEG